MEFVINILCVDIDALGWHRKVYPVNPKVAERKWLHAFSSEEAVLL
jgi:hypothetical protein